MIDFLGILYSCSMVFYATWIPDMAVTGVPIQSYETDNIITEYRGPNILW